MPESTDLVAVIHQTVSTSKELAETFQDKIAEARRGQVTLDVGQVQAAASQLRITANLVSNLIEENSRIMDLLEDAIARLQK